MTTAYVLISALVGRGPQVLASLGGLREVRFAERVNGPHDIIAKVEVADLIALGRFVQDKVHTVPGVVKTITCVAVK